MPHIPARDNSRQQRLGLVKTLLSGSNPHCILPSQYFEEILCADGSAHKKKMLSISSWDGREIFTLERLEEDVA
jgi:hypothetical protein